MPPWRSLPARRPRGAQRSSRGGGHGRPASARSSESTPRLARARRRSPHRADRRARATARPRPRPRDPLVRGAPPARRVPARRAKASSLRAIGAGRHRLWARCLSVRPPLESRVRPDGRAAPVATAQRQPSLGRPPARRPREGPAARRAPPRRAAPARPAPRARPARREPRRAPPVARVALRAPGATEPEPEPAQGSTTEERWASSAAAAGSAGRHTPARLPSRESRDGRRACRARVCRSGRSCRRSSLRAPSRPWPRRSSPGAPASPSTRRGSRS